MMLASKWRRREWKWDQISVEVFGRLWKSYFSSFQRFEVMRSWFEEFSEIVDKSQTDLAIIADFLRNIWGD